MELKRRKLQGALNILSFNRHFYFTGFALLGLLLTVSFYFEIASIIRWSILAAFLYGLIMPLLVSAYVYDLSGFYDFNWLKDLNLKKADNTLIVNINAGFDETSFILKDAFPDSELQVYDFYDQKLHTEPAIIRARKVSLVYPGTQQINSYSIPLEDNTVDLIFLLSAVHEIRSNEEKVQFLKECRRICKADAKVIMVEHLRDFPNFLAFTVGFTHFFSRATWRTAFKRAGFGSFNETKFTPFMSIFNCAA